MKVRAKCDAFIDNFFRNQDDVFEYEGPPNKNLERLDGKKWPKDKKPVEDDPDFT